MSTGHCGRPAHCAMDWTSEEGRRKRGKPKKTWRATFKQDLQIRGISRCEVEATAAERTRWRYLAAHCPAKDRKTKCYVLESEVGFNVPPNIL